MAKQEPFASITLPAPQGWTKKLTPRKSGTPKKNDIVFISPTGEEIKSKRQLDKYIKANPGSPSALEFDWGTGDTPRRSSRLSVQAKETDTPEKETETPESDPPKKKQKKSSSKKAPKGKSQDGDGEDNEVSEQKETTDVTKETEDGEGNEVSEQKETTDATAASSKETEEVEMKDAKEEETVKEAEQQTEEKIEEPTVEKPVNQEDAEEEKPGTHSDLPAVSEETKPPVEEVTPAAAVAVGVGDKMEEDKPQVEETPMATGADLGVTEVPPFETVEAETESAVAEWEQDVGPLETVQVLGQNVGPLETVQAQTEPEVDKLGQNVGPNPVDVCSTESVVVDAGEVKLDQESREAAEQVKNHLGP